MFLGACRRRRRRGGLQLYHLRAAWGATGQLSGIRLGLWVSASGGAAQSASMFIENALGSVIIDVLMKCSPSFRANGSDQGQKWAEADVARGPPSTAKYRMLPPHVGWREGN